MSQGKGAASFSSPAGVPALLLCVLACLFFITTAHAKVNKPAGEALPAPEFSHQAGFYDTGFKLGLSHTDNDTTIYYTLDGSIPDPDNLTGSTYAYKNKYQQPGNASSENSKTSDDFLYNEYKTHKYNGPIDIYNRTYEPDRISQISTTFDEVPSYLPDAAIAAHWLNDLVDFSNRGIKEINRSIRKINDYAGSDLGAVPDINYKKRKNQDENIEYSFAGTPVRAVAVRKSGTETLTSPVVTKTYFIGKRAQFNLPIVALSVPETALYDYNDGIFVAGKDYDNFVQSGQTISGAKHHRHQQD